MKGTHSILQRNLRPQKDLKASATAPREERVALPLAKMRFVSPEPSAQVGLSCPLLILTNASSLGTFHFSSGTTSLRRLHEFFTL